MKVFNILAILLLATLFLCEGYLAAQAGKKKSSKKPSKKTSKKSCNVYAAYKSLMKENKYGQFADFIWLLKVSGLEKELKKLAKGKVLLAPTNPHHAARHGDHPPAD
jgi:hypothetical protein